MHDVHSYYARKRRLQRRRERERAHRTAETAAEKEERLNPINCYFLRAVREISWSGWSPEYNLSISVGITFVYFLGILVFHTYQRIRKLKLSLDVCNSYRLKKQSDEMAHKEQRHLSDEIAHKEPSLKIISCLFSTQRIASGWWWWWLQLAR